MCVKKIILIVLITFCFLIILPIIISIIISLNTPNWIWKIDTQNDWIGFLGGYAGSIIGGLCTLVGVWLALRLEQKRHEYEQIPNMIIKLDKLLNIVNSYECLEFRHTFNKDINTLESIKKFLDYVILNKREEALSFAVEVNTKVFAYTQGVFLDLKLLSAYVDSKKLKSSVSTFEITP
jgi:hypothetical protein